MKYGLQLYSVRDSAAKVAKALGDSLKSWKNTYITTTMKEFQ